MIVAAISLLAVVISLAAVLNTRRTDTHREVSELWEARQGDLRAVDVMHVHSSTHTE